MLETIGMVLLAATGLPLVGFGIVWAGTPIGKLALMAMVLMSVAASSVRPPYDF